MVKLRAVLDELHLSMLLVLGCRVVGAGNGQARLLEVLVHGPLLEAQP